MTSEPYSDFYIEHRNTWFGSKGELYYILSRICFYIKRLTFSVLDTYKIALPFDAIFFVEASIATSLYKESVDFVHLCIGYWSYSKFFFFLSSFTSSFSSVWANSSWNLGFSSTSDNEITYSTHITYTILKFMYNRPRYFTKLANINVFVGQTAEVDPFILNNNDWLKISSLTFQYMSRPLQIEKDLSMSNIAPFILSKVKVAFRSTRLSHWLWGGKDKNIFLIFSGEGDAYSFDSSVFDGFDENLQIPHASKFVDFYTQDLFRNSFLFFQNVRHRLVLEWVWTFLPTLILLSLVIPSLYLLYTYDRPYVTAPYMTFKAIGNQWYWAYEYWDYENSEQNSGLLSFESNMLHEDDLDIGQLRLLEVDRRLVLPAGVCIRLITTSVDVLHSWAVPAFGVKIDSVPGRLNQFWLVLNKPGVFYGQCSELCGVNHGFMPIAVEVVFLEQFLEFLQLESLEQ